MIAVNITGIITGKFLKAYRKPEENGTNRGKQKNAAPAAVHFSEKNPKTLYVRHVWINSINIIAVKNDQKNKRKYKNAKILDQFYLRNIFSSHIESPSSVIEP